MSTHNIKLAIEVSEQLTNLCKKLSGSDGDVWFREFGKFLKKEPAWEKPVIFKVIEMGIHKNLESYLKDFKKTGAQINNSYTMSILRKVKWDEPRHTLALSALTVAELGFSNGATAGEIFEAAKKIGLELCPAGVGPYLRLQFLDQTVGNLVIAMEPVESSDGNLLFFGVVNDGDGLWLCDYYGFPDRYWNARDRFVFVKPN